ncbi:hypothetical protein AwWohl_10730 [Gammaproteobacteria bacterium]|nr:hypothetical protein AwWohl_10730 [Gammaproteobacteria bacterium]
MFIRFICILDKFTNRMTRFSGYIATTALFVMLGIIMLNVFLRYVMNNSLHWVEEMARYLMVWMTFLYFPMGHKKHLNVKVDFAVSWFKNSIAGKILILILECIIFCAVIFFVSLTWGMVLNASNFGTVDFISNIFNLEYLRTTTTSNALTIPMCYVYLVMPVSFCMVALCSFENILHIGASLFGCKLNKYLDQALLSDLSSDLQEV